MDILPEGPEDDGIAYLSFFVEEEESGGLLLNGESVTEEEILTRVKEELNGLRPFCEIGEGSISVDETEISTGSTTGSSISINLPSTICWSFRPGKR